MSAQRIWLNGKLVAPQEAVVSVYDHGLLYGDGVFEGIRIYGGRILKLRTHLRRLYEGARHLDLKVPYTLEELEAACREAVLANDLANGYIRLCVTRGAGTLGLNPYQCLRPNTFIIVDLIELYPPEVYEQGLSIVTAAMIRNHPAALSPRIKSLNYLNNILAKLEAIQAGARDALMLNHLGFLSEATGANVFIVRNGQGDRARVATPPLHAGILEGVTRNLVIRLARKAGFEVAERDLTRHDLFSADEVFLTGTAAEVVPVTRIDGRVVGDGRPGPVTGQLLEAFRKLVRHAPED